MLNIYCHFYNKTLILHCWPPVPGRKRHLLTPHPGYPPPQATGRPWRCPDLCWWPAYPPLPADTAVRPRARPLVIVDLMLAQPLLRGNIHPPLPGTWSPSSFFSINENRNLRIYSFFLKFVLRCLK